MTIAQFVNLVSALNVTADDMQAVLTFTTAFNAQNAYFKAINAGFDAVQVGTVLTIYSNED